MGRGLVMLCDVDLEAHDATRIHTVEVARGFAAEGFNVDLVARGPDPQIDGVRYNRAFGDEMQRVVRPAAANLLAMRLLWRRRRSASRLYVRYRWSSVPVLAVGRMLGYRVVAQVDDMPYGRGYENKSPFVIDRIKRLATRAMGYFTNGIVAVTPELKGLLVDQFRVPPERVTVLPNGADIDFFRPQPRSQAIAKAGLEPDHPYVVFSGRFQPWVDFDTLLEAFAGVVHQRNDARLLLVGDGMERERVERSIHRLRIDHAVVITGLVEDRKRVRDLIGAATVTISANRPEYRTRIGVSPVKLAEYLASGRAVVATDLPGLKETLEETGAGVVVPVDASAMSDAILDLLDPERADKLGVSGRRIAEERYAWSSIVKRTVPLFGGAVSDVRS